MRRVSPQLDRHRKESQIRGRLIGFDTRSPHTMSPRLLVALWSLRSRCSQLTKLFETAMHREQTMLHLGARPDGMRPPILMITVRPCARRKDRCIHLLQQWRRTVETIEECIENTSNGVSTKTWTSATGNGDQGQPASTRAVSATILRFPAIPGG